MYQHNMQCTSLELSALLLSYLSPVQQGLACCLRLHELLLHLHGGSLGMLQLRLAGLQLRLGVASQALQSLILNLERLQ